MATTTRVRAAIYARISKDHEGRAAGVTRQIRECVDLARGRGLEVIGDPYVDNDMSASTRKRRPEYERLMADVEAGRVDAIIAWHPDRLIRKAGQDLESFIDRASHAEVVTVQAGRYDLSTPTGRAVARTIGAWARHEVELKGERQRSAYRQIAESGRRLGGGTRGFGYDAAHTAVIPAEAEVIREGANHVLAGGSLRSLTNAWRARGVPTVTGAEWSTTAVKKLLTSARIAGWRERHGEFVAEGDWPAIVSREEVERLRAILNDPARKHSPAFNARSYLLTGGTARCGRCGAALVARSKGGSVRAYQCAKDHGGCGGLTIKRDTLEAYVVDQLLAALDTKTLSRLRRAAVSDDAELVRATEEIAALGQRQRENAESFSAGRLSVAAYEAADASISQMIEGHRALLAGNRGASFVSSLPATRAELDAWWDDDTTSLDERRQLVALVIEAVEIGPAVRGRTAFDPARVSIRWRR